jgi:hypothetical protein
MPHFIDNPGTLYGKELWIQALLQPELHRIQVGYIEIVIIILKFEIESTFRPREKRIDHLLDLFPDHILNNIMGNVELPGEYRAEPFLAIQLLLDGHRLFQGMYINNPFLNQDFSQVLLKAAGRSTDNLPMAENDLPLTPPAVEGERTGFPAETHYLQDFTEAKIFEITDKTHMRRTLTKKIEYKMPLPYATCCSPGFRGLHCTGNPGRIDMLNPECANRNESTAKPADQVKT